MTTTPPAAASARASSRWEILRVAERIGPKFTLGDVLLQLPSYDGSSDELRGELVAAADAAGAHVESAPNGEVIYVFPHRARAAVLARDARENSAAFSRRTWRGALALFRGLLATFLIVSVCVVFLALVAITIIALTQNRGGGGRGGDDVLPVFFTPGGGGGGGGFGGGPYYRHHGAGMDNFWFYLYMRDIWWFTYWNEHEHRRMIYERGMYGGRYGAHVGRINVVDENGVAIGVPVRPHGGKGGPGRGGGETASHTTPFAWCTPFLKDFSRRHSSPALPFQRLTGKTFN